MKSVLVGKVALIGVILGMLAARTARADPGPTSPVFVLTIWTEDADDQADALTRALRVRVGKTPGWALEETNQSFETLSIALKCPTKPDAACLLRIGDQLKASHYIWGTIDKRKGAAEVSANLHMWARGKMGVEAHGAFSDSLKDPNDEVLQQIAGELFNQLAGIVPTPAPKPPVVDPAPPPDTVPPVVSPSPEPGSESSGGGGIRARTAIAYTTLAVGAGFLAGAVVEAANWVSDSNASTKDRQQVPTSVTDVCTASNNAAALDACNKASDATKASTLGWIFAGVGVGLVGTGLWLVLTDHPAKAHTNDEARAHDKLRVDVEPSIGPRAGSLRVRLTF